MKGKPRVVSKNAKGFEATRHPVEFTLKASPVKDGIGIERSAALVRVSDFDLSPNGAIGQVDAFYMEGYILGSGASSAVRWNIVDGAAGGALTLTGSFTAGKISKNGIIRKGTLIGYATTATGVFDDAGLYVGNPFTGTLGRGGRQWTLLVDRG